MTQTRPTLQPHASSDAGDQPPPAALGDGRANGRADAARRPLNGLDDLIRAGLVAAEARDDLQPVEEAFRIRVTPVMAEIPARGVRDQFVPQPRESHVLPEEMEDPIGDEVHSPVEGLTHRYPDRVILHATQTCEVYCRFCFRREAVGENGTLSDAAFEQVCAYLAANPQIWEVIFTGGDPLVLSPRRLARMLDKLAEIPSIEVIRFHTRVPVVSPERITPELIAALQVRPAVWMVIHTNHPDEITPEARAAFAAMVQAGIPLLSQSVLLKGINDDPATLEQLFRALIRNRVKPYYLHHPDLAKGTSHFRLGIEEGQTIMAALRGRISGTALPLYVLDIPGGHGKVPIGPGYLERSAAGVWTVTDPQSRRHLYRDL